jgi:hypothetical protein
VYRACESIAHDRSVQCIGRRQRDHILQELSVKERLLQSQTHAKHTQGVAEKVNARTSSAACESRRTLE